MVSVSLALKSGSLIVTAENGWSMALSFTVWPTDVPVIAGASFTDVATTVVVALVVGEPTIPSVTDSVMPVVTVLPGATSFAVGVNTKARSAVVTDAGVPAVSL